MKIAWNCDKQRGREVERRPGDNVYTTTALGCHVQGSGLAQLKVGSMASMVQDPVFT